MKNLVNALFILLLFTWTPQTLAITNVPCNAFAFAKTFPKSKEPSQILCYKRYAVGFSIVRHTPLWSAQSLSAEQVAKAVGVRKDRFRVDPQIGSNFQGSLAAYVGTPYDRGHLTGFEDLADDLAAADESFYMTNIVPQYAVNNRGIWKALESRTRKLATAKGQIFVISGPIFEKLDLSLKDSTPIPTKLFKIIIIPSTNEVITYIIPNSLDAKSADLPKYVSDLATLKKVDFLLASFVATKPKLKELKVFPAQ